MKYIKNFESIRDEFPGMFEPRKKEDLPQVVPGFETGTIDPEDDEVYDFKGDGNIRISDAESYKKFIEVTKERNFIETNSEIKINIRRLFHDFYMSITNSRKHFIKFINKELIGKYISNGFYFDNIVSNDSKLNLQGIIEKVYIMFDDDLAFINLKLRNQDFSDYNGCENIIILDKKKSTADKYNL